MILQTDWRLALFSLTVLPFVLVPTARLGKRLRGSTREAQDAAADLNQTLQETLGGHQVVKSFGGEQAEADRFREKAHLLRRANLKYVAQQAIASPLIEFFGAATIVALLTYARGQILAAAMTSGEFFTFLTALLMLYEPVKRLTGIHNIFQQALGRVAESLRVSGSHAADRRCSGRHPAGSVSGQHSARPSRVPLSRRGHERIEWDRPDGAGRGGRGAGGLLGSGQDDGGEPDPALLRRDRRSHQDRRDRHSHGDTGLAARADQPGGAGYVPL